MESEAAPMAAVRTEAATLTNTAVYFYVWDQVGSVRVVTDGSGNLVVIHDYEPYGVEIRPNNPTAMPADALAGTHLYTGQERDADTGLDNFHFRSYASTMGRFLSPDDIPGTPLNPQSFNLYAYVHGNPVNYNDPTGHYAGGYGAYTSYSTRIPGDPDEGYGEVWIDGMDTGTAASIGAPGQTEMENTITPAMQNLSPWEDPTLKVHTKYWGDYDLHYSVPQQTDDTDNSGNHRLAERIVMSGEAAINLEVARIKLGLGLLAVLGTPETSGGSDIAAAYLGYSGAGSLATAGVQMVGALTGKVHEAALGAKAIGTVTTVTGLGDLLWTRDLNQAAKWSAREMVVTADPDELFGGSPLQFTAKFLDWMQSARDAF